MCHQANVLTLLCDHRLWITKWIDHPVPHCAFKHAMRRARYKNQIDIAVELGPINPVAHMRFNHSEDFRLGCIGR